MSSPPISSYSSTLIPPNALSRTLANMKLKMNEYAKVATTLIIYYKQISEGYEDRKRFQIMEKIGMSQVEVKGSIRNQILLVFFLPLLVAGIHICFAFPLLTRLLNLLLLPKVSLFVLCTSITFLVFATVYIVIYSITAKTYYKIVH